MTTDKKVRKGVWAAGAAVFGAAGAGALIIAPMAATPADARPIVVEAPNGAPMSFADLIERVSPAVVSVAVVTEVETADAEDLIERFRGLPGFEDFMDRYGAPGQGDDDDADRRRGRSVGSGFFISAEGHIVTNNHVVEDATEVKVALKDGTELEATVIGTDPQSDLAVLKVDDGRYPYVQFSDLEPPRVGDWVVAVGNPFNLGGTATAGIVSAVGREIGGPYTDFIQIDAPINRGNSGGPTFDLRGQVVGVNTAIFSPSGGSVGIGFAIEAAAAKQIVNALIETGEVSRGWLGVSIQSVTDEIAESQNLDDARGAIVSDVVDDSPAEASGFERGDIILAVNGDKVDDSRDVTRRVGSLLAGSENTFKVLRDGRQRDINVTIAKRPENLETAAIEPRPWSDDEETGDLYLGAELRDLDDDARASLGLKSGEAGLFVAELRRDSPLREAGIGVGDALLEANGEALRSVAAFKSTVEDAREDGKSNLLIAVRKGRNTLFLTVDISED